MPDATDAALEVERPGVVLPPTTGLFPDGLEPAIVVVLLEAVARDLTRLGAELTRGRRVLDDTTRGHLLAAAGLLTRLASTEAGS